MDEVKKQPNEGACVIDEIIKLYKTSWKYLKRKGFENAEEFGDCIFLESISEADFEEELKQSIAKVLDEWWEKEGGKSFIELKQKLIGGRE